MARRPRARRRERKSIPVGRAYIQSTFNNTIITITDPQGNPIAWGSSGTVGFRGSRKSTAFVAQRAGEDAARKGMEHGIRQVEVFVRGPGSGREGGHPRAPGRGNTGDVHQGRYPDSAQRMQTSQAPPGVERVVTRAVECWTKQRRDRQLIERGVIDVLGDTFSIYWRHFRKFIILVAIIQIPVVVIELLLSLVFSE